MKYSKYFGAKRHGLIKSESNLAPKGASHFKTQNIRCDTNVAAFRPQRTQQQQFRQQQNNNCGQGDKAPTEATTTTTTDHCRTKAPTHPEMVNSVFTARF